MNICRWMLLLGIVGTLGACEKDLDRYSGKNYIRFALNQKEDSVIYNFGLAGKTTADRIPLEMVISGDIPDRDRAYKVSVNARSTAREGVHFVLPEENLVFRKGLVTDTLWLEVKNTEELKRGEVYLQLDLEANDNFSLCFPDNNSCKLYLSDIIEKPGWWDEWHETEGLGRYSEKKFRLFVQVSGVSDLSKTEYPEKREAILKLKYHLEEEAAKGNVILDEDNTPMRVAMYG